MTVKNKLEELKKAGQPLVDLLNESNDYNPYHIVIVSQGNIELLEGKMSVPNKIID